MLDHARPRIRDLLFLAGLPFGALLFAAWIDAPPMALFVLLALGVVLTSSIAGRERGAASAFVGTALLDGYRAAQLPAGRTPGGTTAVASMVILLVCAVAGSLGRMPRARSAGSVGPEDPSGPQTPRPVQSSVTASSLDGAARVAARDESIGELVGAGRS